MAKNLHVGDRVYVPWTRLGVVDDKPSALHYTRVVEVNQRSVVVEMPDANRTTVASSAVLKNLGIAVIRIGDLETEVGLLDPLAKSVLQFLRLLNTDDSFTRLFETRSLAELRHFWENNGGALSHVVLIGHGSDAGIRFGTEGTKSAQDIGEIVAQDGQRKQFISLCCHTGRAAFAKAFSGFPACESIIAPFDSVHGAVASQFCQTFFAFHLLNGITTTVAFKNTCKSVPGNHVLKLWQNSKRKG